MIFDGLFGKKQDPNAGKFVRHAELASTSAAAFGPLGIVCGGLGEDELEVLSERVEGVLSGVGVTTGEIPIAVLGKEDMNDCTTLANVLEQMEQRNSVLPDDPVELSMPLVLFSGLTPMQLSAATRAVMASGIRGGLNGQLNLPVCAAAVPKAMSKTINQLVEEITDDALVNEARA